MGKEQDALARARRMIDAWTRAKVDASSSPPRAAARRSRTMATCCGSIPPMPRRRRRSPPRRRDITEFLAEIDLPEVAAAAAAAHRLSFGLLDAAWPEDHARAAGAARARRASRSPTCRRAICAAARPAPTTSCSPRSPRRLRDRKVANIESVAPDIIATGNIGCITQIAQAARHIPSCNGRVARLGLWRAMNPGRLRASDLKG